MRNTLICLALLLVAIIGYAEHKNPAGCSKVLADLGDLCDSLVSPTPSTPTNAPAAVAPVPPPTPVAVAPPPPATNAPSPIAPISSPPPPVKEWVAPSVIPAQPNWTWTAMDGKTYQNVVITKIEPDVVSITHSLGVARLPIANLPEDIQKQLNYDPVAAAAIAAERQRELDHPYYALAALADAQAAARQTHMPLAWVVSGPAFLAAQNPQSGSSGELTQMAMSDLQKHAIIIYVDGYTELMSEPKPVIDQLFHMDDGELPGGHHFIPPKIVFTSPDATTAFGRVSSTQMKATREVAIDEALAAIAKDPAAQAALHGQPASAP